jgi:NAD(P)H-hydrate epimerase
LAKRDRLAELLRKTAQAHHRAFAATDGADPDWPAWYARYLCENGFEHQMEGDTLSVTRLTRLLIEADRQHRAKAPGTPWELFYAKLLRARAHGSK